MFSKVLHHFHVRRRVSEKLEEYPSREPVKNIFDKLIYFFGISGPIMLLPQVWMVWSRRDATGLSVVSWFWFVLVSFVWFGYGIVHRDRPIMITYFLWIVTQSVLFIGILLY